MSTQYAEMGEFYHGKEPTHPSQIDLLSKAAPPYSLLYELKHVNSTNKNDDISTVSRFSLKEILTRDKSCTYYSQEDIFYRDLEKKNRTGGQLRNGHQLHDMAKRGMKAYKKALSYCAQKYDIKTQTIKESGTFLEDVIEYVRCRMYLHNKKDNSIVVDDGESEGEELIEELIHDEENLCSGEQDHIAVATEASDKATHATSKLSMSGSDTVEVDKTVNDDGNISEDEFEEVPDSYMFPSFFAFVAWGPFAELEDQLNIMLTDDTNKKKGDGIRAKLRAKVKGDKDSSRQNDSVSERGYSISQQIEMEHLNVQKQTMLDRQNETAIVALSIEEGAIGRQLLAAETRADSRCPVYDPNNSYWKRVDVLIAKQENVMQRISSFTANKTVQADSNVDIMVPSSKGKGNKKR